MIVTGNLHYRSTHDGELSLSERVHAILPQVAPWKEISSEEWDKGRVPFIDKALKRQDFREARLRASTIKNPKMRQEWITHIEAVRLSAIEQGVSLFDL